MREVAGPASVSWTVDDSMAPCVAPGSGKAGGGRRAGQAWIPRSGPASCVHREEGREAETLERSDDTGSSDAGTAPARGVDGGSEFVRIPPPSLGGRRVGSVLRRLGEAARRGLDLPVDSVLFEGLIRWVRSRHPSKRMKWLVRRYFRFEPSRPWVFWARRPSRQGSLFPELSGDVLRLMRASSVSIRRHVKIRAEANPFDPQWDRYFRRRSGSKAIAPHGAIT